MSVKLIIGLGNPGNEYAGNRHNVGFMCVNHFARVHGIKFEKKQGLARIGMGKVDGQEIVLARPQTYMNSSGESVMRLANKYQVALEDLVVIHDDLDLPPGKIRLRCGGSSAGHKGVASIISLLGSPDFIRLRVGISHPPDIGTDVIDYVLSDFTPDELKIINTSIPRAGEALLCLLTEGLEVAMNRFN